MPAASSNPRVGYKNGLYILSVYFMSNMRMI